MFDLVSLFKLALGVAGSIAKMMENRQLLKAGESKAIAEMLSDANEKISNAVAAGRAADNDGVQDPFNED